eukprot:14196336-Alexandrium_andersonii.AAC.1
MSASLVGSEMCIRDSLWRAPESVGAHPESLQRDAREPPESHRRASRGPVSYTHLTLPTICSV